MEVKEFSMEQLLEAVEQAVPDEKLQECLKDGFFKQLTKVIIYLSNNSVDKFLKARDLEPTNFSCALGLMTPNGVFNNQIDVTITTLKPQEIPNESAE